MGDTRSTESDKSANQLALGRRMVQLINGFQLSAAIGAVARLGVADELAHGPALAEDLGVGLGIHAPALERVLHALAESGVFEELPDGRFGLAPLGELLRSDAPQSARRAAMLWTEEWHWRAYGYFTESLRTGEAGMRLAHGTNYWDYLAGHPETAATFNAVMSSASSVRAQALARSYDFRTVDRLVDVGGGEGSLVREVLQSYPRLRGVVFDLPEVVEGADKGLIEAGLEDRAEIVSGNFFDGVPGGDLYVLSWILHDWDDESAVRILSNCRAAITDAGRLLVIEMVLPSADEPRSAQSVYVEQLANAMDLEMLAVVGGRERTRAEYEVLLRQAGFEIIRVSVLQSFWSMIEAAPV
jgi:hypothetical protein